MYPSQIYLALAEKPLWAALAITILAIVVFREYQLRVLLRGSGIYIHGTGWLGAYVGGIRFYIQSKKMIFEGYSKVSGFPSY